MGLAAALDQVLATFRAVQLPDGSQLRAFDDSAQVTPPCVWVPVPTLEFNFSKRVASVTWDAYLVAPPSSTKSVSPTLSQLVDAVTGLFPFTTGQPQLLTLHVAMTGAAVLLLVHPLDIVIVGRSPPVPPR